MRDRNRIKSIITQSIEDADGDGLVLTEADAAAKLAKAIIQTLEDFGFTVTRSEDYELLT